VKRRIRGLAVVLGGFCVAAATFYVYFDRAVGAAIERGATGALGVPTQVGFIRLVPLAGELRARRLRIRNPPGFRDRNIVEFERVEVDLSLPSLREPTILIPRLEIVGVEASLERAGGKTNYGVLQGNLQRFRDELGGSLGDAAEKPGGRSFLIEEIRILAVRAEVDLASLPGAIDRVTVHVPEIRLHNIGTSAGGVGIGQVSGVIYTAVMLSIAKQAPAEVAGRLFHELAGLRSLAPEVSAALLGTDWQRALEDAARSLGDAARGLEAGAKRAAKSLGDLFTSGEDD